MMTLTELLFFRCTRGTHTRGMPIVHLAHFSYWTRDRTAVRLATVEVVDAHTDLLGTAVRHQILDTVKGFGQLIAGVGLLQTAAHTATYLAVRLDTVAHASNRVVRSGDARRVRRTRIFAHAYHYFYYILNFMMFVLINQLIVFDNF